MTRSLHKIIDDVESLPTGNLSYDETKLYEVMIETLRLCSETFQLEDRYDDLHFLVDSLIIKSDKVKELWWE